MSEANDAASFGKYFLVEKLATGGMAEIYLAKLVGPGGFEKQLVIKQIHPKLSGQHRFVDLFVAEAKTLVALAHGNIVPVYELGVIDDTYFIAMDYIDGPTLYRLTETLARRDVRMAPAMAAWITARILEGLDYAHRKGDGVIHRDLSPRNVMLSRDGEVKLVDFGIAVPLGAADDADADSSAPSPPTGSFPYMSPEQVRREPLTGQTDLFSVGVLAWEMLAGQRLFARSDPDATLRAVTDGDIPRPSHVDPTVPARLDDVVMRALERDRGARWPSAGEMLQELQRYLYSLDETPGPRDVAALVARHCPPETRRLPTHADPPTADSDPVPLGPRTAKLDRPPRLPRARTETFAARAELQQLLVHAPDADGPPAAAPAPPSPAAAQPSAQATAPPPSTRASGDEPAPAAPVPAPAARPLPGHTPPNQGILVLLALGTLGVGVAAVVVFLRGGGAIDDLPDAGTDAISPRALVDAAIAADAPPSPADAPIDALPVDAAAPPHDAPARPPRIGSGSTGEAVKPLGDGTLIVGANPWGDIIIDGVKRGRTPTTLVVPAGKHTIDIVFGGEDPPRSKRFTIELRPGDSQRLNADFTSP